MYSGNMKTEALLDSLAAVKVWAKGDTRAPNKPLLLLLVLARLQRRDTGTVRYSEIEKPLTQLLIDFGPRRKSVHPEYPFWYLQNDGVWQIRDSDQMKRRKAKDIPTRTEFRNHDPSGALTPEIAKILIKTPHLIPEAARRILDASFPSSVHDDISAAVGLDMSDVQTVKRKKRDPAFRAKVLRAYEHRCAVCGFDLRLGKSDLALEAAHIKWHQAGGPDTEANGLALCALHHKLLDRGAYSVSDDHRVIVSQEVFGASGFEDVLLRHMGEPLRGPQLESYKADIRYLGWHRAEVFWSPAR